jgi:predicted 2-oxoglutarate/Fe(II)-dependent dioxygenase YbiX
MELKEEAPDIFSFQLFSAAEAAALVAACAGGAWVPALVSGDGSPSRRPEMRRCSERKLSDMPRLAPVVDAALSRAARLAVFCWQAPVKQAGGETCLVRYEAGDFYEVHVDYHPDCAAVKRQISLVCYLNEDFEGGRTVFPRQGLTVAPRAGRALLFPSGLTHPHGAEPVTRGTRLVLVSWLA